MAGLEFEYEITGPHTVEIAAFAYGECAPAAFPTFRAFYLSSPDSVQYSQSFANVPITINSNFQGFEFKQSGVYSASNYCDSLAPYTDCFNGQNLDYTVREYKISIQCPSWSDKWLIEFRVNPSPAYVSNINASQFQSGEVYIDFSRKSGSGPEWYMRDLNFLAANSNPVQMNWGGHSRDSIAVEWWPFPSGYTFPYSSSFPFSYSGNIDLQTDGELKFAPLGTQAPYLSFKVNEFDSLGNLIAYSTRTRILNLSTSNTSQNLFPEIDSTSSPIMEMGGKDIVFLDPSENSFSLFISNPSGAELDYWLSNAFSFSGIQDTLNDLGQNQYRLDINLPVDSVDVGIPILFKLNSGQCPQSANLYRDIFFQRVGCEFLLDTLRLCPPGQKTPSLNGTSFNWTPGTVVSDSTLAAPFLPSGYNGWLKLSTNLCTDSFFVDSQAGILVDLGNDSFYCADDTLWLNPQISSPVAFTYSIYPKPDTLAWQGNQVAVSPIQSAIWTAIAENSYGCSARDTILVETPSWTIDMQVENVDCGAPGSGSVTASVSIDSVQYIWNDPGAQTDSVAVNLQPGEYVVTVIDSQGCAFKDSAQVYSDSFSFDLTSWVDTLCNGFTAPVFIQNFMAGDTARSYTNNRYHFSWGSTGLLDSVSNFTAYVRADSTSGIEINLVIVDSLSSCRDSANLTLRADTATSVILLSTGCLDSSYSSRFELQPFRPSNQLIWTIADSQFYASFVSYVRSLNDPHILPYSLEIRGGACQGFSSGITQTDTNCVWPGDMNRDGLVDNFDIFPYAVYQWNFGPARSTISGSWEPKQAPDWGSTIAGFPNAKFADADGSGQVNPLDFREIKRKYMRSHPKDGTEGEGPSPTILVEFSKDTFRVGDTVQVYYSLLLDDSTVYALAFRHFFDPSWAIDSSISFDYHGVFDPSGMGQPNVISIPMAEGTEYHWGITSRQLNVGVDTAGVFASMQFIIPPDVFPDSADVITMKLNLFSQESMNRRGDFLGANVQENIAIIKRKGTGIKSLTTADFYIFPNPATESVTIELEQAGGELSLIDLSGSVLLSRDVQKTQIEFDLAELPAGCYFLEYRSDQRARVKKLIVR